MKIERVVGFAEVSLFQHLTRTLCNDFMTSYMPRNDIHDSNSVCF